MKHSKFAKPSEPASGIPAAGILAASAAVAWAVAGATIAATTISAAVAWGLYWREKSKTKTPPEPKG